MQDEIIRMAREAGYDPVSETLPHSHGFIERFAALVAAHEREKQAEQEPVAWLCDGEAYEVQQYDWQTDLPFPNQIPLYAAPVRTKDLTDDEIISALGADMDTDEDKEWFMEIARLGIAADREKNK